jgi:hypothetical protein
MKTMSLLIVLRFGIAIGILEVPTSTQQLVINYEIPINKIPLFSFVKANYTVITIGRNHQMHFLS